MGRASQSDGWPYSDQAEGFGANATNNEAWELRTEVIAEQENV